MSEKQELLARRMNRIRRYVEQLLADSAAQYEAWRKAAEQEKWS